jgi:hypothetical protein
MPSVLVELPEETQDKIILDSLQQSYFTLKEWLHNRKTDSNCFAMFHTDQQKDILEIIKHIEAFEIVLDYYGCSDPDFYA